MISKIIEISSIGHFTNFKLKPSEKWNGELKKVTIIYAPNGSGKTTLSTILKSYSIDAPQLIKFKKTFSAIQEPLVQLKSLDSPNLIKYKDGYWSESNENVKVFDINFIEEYLFTGSFTRKQNKNNLFRLLLGDEGVSYKKKLTPLYTKSKQLKNKLKSSLEKEIYFKELTKSKELISKFEKEYENYSFSIFENFKTLVNKYLNKFTQYIELSEFSYNKGLNDVEIFRIFPVFEVYGEKIIFGSMDPSKKMGNARYSLSEGDKSTIALCFFLALLEKSKISDSIIVFDDPLSSFDYARKNTTIYNLSLIAEKSKQFILLTHDLGFANDFTKKCSYLETLNLKIENNGNSSYLSYFDIDSEFSTSIQKDMSTIRNFIENGATNDIERREVLRCIRPILEGIIKTKYFNIIPKNNWLGDIINLIKKSDVSSPLNSLKLILSEIEELNDYSKPYHHSNGNQNDEVINNEELKRYINILSKTIYKI